MCYKFFLLFVLLAMVSMLEQKDDFVESSEVDLKSRIPEFVNKILSDFPCSKFIIPLPGGVGGLSHKCEIGPDMNAVVIENGIVHLRNWRATLFPPNPGMSEGVSREVYRVHDYLSEAGYQVSFSSWNRDDMAFDMQIPVSQFEKIVYGK